MTKKSGLLVHPEARRGPFMRSIALEKNALFYECRGLSPCTISGVEAAHWSARTTHSMVSSGWRQARKPNETSPGSIGPPQVIFLKTGGLRSFPRAAKRWARNMGSSCARQMGRRLCAWEMEGADRFRRMENG